MPFTFLPHQVPVLPLAARTRVRWDGMALVAGSIAPDLFYVTFGWLYGPWGIPMWRDGHSISSQPQVIVLACIVSWVMRRVVLPVVPLALPDAGAFHFHDYWAISRRRHRWYVTVYSAALGAATHLFLDAFTHANGFVVTNVAFMREPWFSIGSKQLGLYSALQYGGSLIGGVWAVRMLEKMGRDRHFRRGIVDRAPTLDRRQRSVLWVGIGAGVVGGVLYAWSRTSGHRSPGLILDSDKSAVIISFCWVAFIGLVLGCLAASALSSQRLFRSAE